MLLLYNSSILDIEHSPYYIALGSTLTQKSDLLTTNTLIVIYEALCFVVAQGRMNGAPNETRTHSCRFASQGC